MPRTYASYLAKLICFNQLFKYISSYLINNLHAWQRNLIKLPLVFVAISNANFPHFNGPLAIVHRSRVLYLNERL